MDYNPNTKLSMLPRDLALTVLKILGYSDYFETSIDNIAACLFTGYVYTILHHDTSQVR